MTVSENNFDVIVVGAGLSGLTAAWQLHRKGHSVCVLEFLGDVGGVIQSFWQEGYLIETGPHTFPATGTAIMSLVSQLGIHPEPTSPFVKKRYVYHHKNLHPVPHNPFTFLKTPLLTMAGKFRVLAEPFQKTGTHAETTLSEFVHRRLGPEVLERFVDPFVSGVFAGDAEQLEVGSAFPKLVSLETDGGSLFGGMLKQLRKRKARYRLLGFKNGMHDLPKSIASHLPEGNVRCNSRVIGIGKSGNGYTCTLEAGETLSARTLILATPADVAAELLKPLSSDLPKNLGGIPYAPIATVHFGFDRKTVFHPLDGFGFLVPKSEGLKLLGAIWASSLFTDRAPSGKVLMSCFIGGVRNAGVDKLPEDEIAAQALADLATVFGQPILTPEFQKTIVYQKAIPQYVVGHSARVDAIDEALKNLPSLAICGNYLSGVSLNDCVQSGFNAAERIDTSLAVKA